MGPLESTPAAPASETHKRALRVAATGHKTERLLKITAAIADAVTPQQVFEAVVDEVAAAVEASSAALWLLSQDGRAATMIRSVGYPDEARVQFDGVPLDSPLRFPALDAFRDSEPMWFPTQSALLGRYPHLEIAVTPGREYQVACIPLVVQGRTLGVLAFTFETSPMSDEDQRPFLELVARYSGQALERLRLLTAEKRHARHAEVLFSLAQAVIGSRRLDEVFGATLDSIDQLLGAKRSAILTFDDAAVMRFRAWRGLSDDYRRAVEGHSPWARDAKAPQIVWVADALGDASLSRYHDLFRREGIRALGFVPLVASGELLGKFMVYFDHPHSLTAGETEMASAIAHHIAAATARWAALDELQQTVRFNEMFTAILGHDLRNPLGAIMTSAQLVMKRNESEKVLKPLARIINSGERMARMIDQLLDFTRLRVGAGIPLQPERIDVRPVIEQVIEELDDANPDTAIQLEQRGETLGLWDPDRLAQVFSNLVGNAVEHGRPGATVTVRIDGTAHDALRVEVHNDGGVRIELLPTLFEPMTGADQRGEKSRGLGLGLFISQQIARAHGGGISVDSSEAMGTTFAVTLPRTVVQ